VELVFPVNPALDGFDLDQVAFIDFVHPTAALHGVLGAFGAQAVSSDVHVLTEGRDVVSVGAGDDLVLGKAGRDAIKLGSGDDTGIGGLGRDSIKGGLGNDILIGGAGRDRLLGGADDDILSGNRGNDNLNGGSGNDLIIDGLGADIAQGGLGDDVFLFVEHELLGGQASTRPDLFNGGRGSDSLYLLVTEETAGGLDVDEFGGRFTYIAELGILARGFENIQVITDISELTDAVDLPRLAEAEFWGQL
jgi:Ca2+-binding RTX toxin-like protein